MTESQEVFEDIEDQQDSNVRTKKILFVAAIAVIAYIGYKLITKIETTEPEDFVVVETPTEEMTA